MKSLRCSHTWLLMHCTSEMLSHCPRDCSAPGWHQGAQLIWHEYGHATSGLNHHDQPYRIGAAQCPVSTDKLISKAHFGSARANPLAKVADNATTCPPTNAFKVRCSKQSSKTTRGTSSAPLELQIMLLCTPVQPAVLSVVSLLQSVVSFSCYGAWQLQSIESWPLPQLAVLLPYRVHPALQLAHACVGFWVVMPCWAPCWPPCWPWCISFSTPAAERTNRRSTIH